MKRDMDLVRELLLKLEESSANVMMADLSVQGFTEEELSHHLRIMYGAGLIDAHETTSSSGPGWLIRDITWQGYEFLDDARKSDNWQKAKDLALRTAGSLSLQALQLALGEVVRRAVAGQPQS